MQPLGNRPTKVCPNCGKRKDLEYGFYKDSCAVNGYHSWCKICSKESSVEYEHKKKDYTFRHHLWEEWDSNNHRECIRCGLLQKRESHHWKLGKWVFLHYVNCEWILAPQPCIRKDKQDEMDTTKSVRSLCEQGC